MQGGAVIFSGVDVDVDGNTEVNKFNLHHCPAPPNLKMCKHGFQFVPCHGCDTGFHMTFSKKNLEWNLGLNQ